MSRQHPLFAFQPANPKPPEPGLLHRGSGFVIVPPMTTTPEEPTECPYTAQQWLDLDPDRQSVIRAVAEYLSAQKLPEHPTAEDLSVALNLLRPCPGCVPEEEIDDSLAPAIRRKFAAIYWTGLQLASQELQRRGHQPGQDYNLSLVIDPDHEDFTMVTVVDADKFHCFLHEGHKAWHFHFDTLADLADAVLSVRHLLVDKVTDRLAKEHEIFVVLQGGLAREVAHCPSHIHVTVIDYDTEGVDDERLQKSPLNGQPCCLDHF